MFSLLALTHHLPALYITLAFPCSVIYLRASVAATITAGELTDSEPLQLAPELGSLLQHSEQVRGLHSIQLHPPVDVDLVVEADVHQAGAVLALLTCVLPCKPTTVR